MGNETGWNADVILEPANPVAPRRNGIRYTPMVMPPKFNDILERRRKGWPSQDSWSGVSKVERVGRRWFPAGQIEQDKSPKGC